jgi:hypothetical protein
MTAPTQTGIEVQLTGTDGNAFALIGKVSKALKRAGYRDAAKEMTAKCCAAGSYDALLAILMEYVEVR